MLIDYPDMLCVAAITNGQTDRRMRQNVGLRGHCRLKPLAEIALGGFLPVPVCGSDATVYNDCCIRSTVFTLKISAFVVARHAI
jgi:hypothetical protein